MSAPLSHAALFIDYENIYYFVKNRVRGEHDPSEVSIETISALRRKLSDEYGAQCIVQHAYADFERIGGNAQGACYLIGIETHNVLSTEHKNAADMRLCIDAMDTLYVRPEINHFVLMAGDRDYIPVVQHLRKHAKNVIVAAFRGGASGDLIQVVEERNYLEATDLLPSGVELGDDRSVKPREEGVVRAAVGPAIGNGPNGMVIPNGPISQPLPPVEFAAERTLMPGEKDVLDVMLEFFGDKPEIWVTPLLRRLRIELPQLAEYERRALITDLAEKGAIVVQKRPGTEGEFSVIVVNWNHADVRAMNRG